MRRELMLRSPILLVRLSIPTHPPMSIVWVVTFMASSDADKGSEFCAVRRNPLCVVLAFRRRSLGRPLCAPSWSLPSQISVSAFPRRRLHRSSHTGQVRPLFPTSSFYLLLPLCGISAIPPPLPPLFSSGLLLGGSMGANSLSVGERVCFPVVCVYISRNH